MGTFDRQRATATRLIAKNGQTVTWRQLSATGTNAAKPTGTGKKDNTVKIVFLSPKLQIFNLFLTMMDKTEIQSGGLVGLMANVPFIPNLNDVVLRGSEVLAIADKNGIDALDPNGEGVILYKIRFTR